MLRSDFATILILFLALQFPAWQVGAMPKPGEVLEGQAFEKAKGSKKKPAKKGQKQKKIGFSSWSDTNFYRCYLLLNELTAEQTANPEDGAGIGVQIMTDAPAYGSDQEASGSFVSESGEEQAVYYAFSFEMPRDFLTTSPNEYHYVVKNQDAESEGDDFNFDVEFDGRRLSAVRRIRSGTELEDMVEITLTEGLDPVDLDLSLTRGTVPAVKINRCAFPAPPGEDEAAPPE